MTQMRLCRGIVIVAGASLCWLALGMFFLLPGATRIWIWPKTSPLGFDFVAAMLAGAGTPLIWIGLSGQLPALRAAMLSGVVANSGIALHLYANHALPGKERYLPYAALFAFGTILASAVFRWSRRLPETGDRPSPPVIRWLFLLFSAILLPVGVAMVVGIPHIFPIPLTPDAAAVYGWFFLGSFAYYLYGSWKSSQFATTGHLISFVTYDLLMLPSYFKYWTVAGPEFRVSLFAYLVVLIMSAIICGYFLLLDPRTRLFRGEPGVA